MGRGIGRLPNTYTATSIVTASRAITCAARPQKGAVAGRGRRPVHGRLSRGHGGCTHGRDWSQAQRTGTVAEAVARDLGSVRSRDLRSARRRCAAPSSSGSASSRGEGDGKCSPSMSRGSSVAFAPMPSGT